MLDDMRVVSIVGLEQRLNDWTDEGLPHATAMLARVRDPKTGIWSEVVCVRDCTNDWQMIKSG